MDSREISARKQEAIEKIQETSAGMKRWAEKIRLEDGKAYKFKWAEKSLKDACIPSTGYAVGAFVMFGIFDDIISEEDKKDGIDWVMSHFDGRNFIDRVLIGERPSDWPADKEYPTPAMMMSAEGYAYAILDRYGCKNPPKRKPPKGLPEPEDWQQTLEFIKTRDLDNNPWGDGSHATRMLRFLYDAHIDGKVPYEPVEEAVLHIMSKQNPETGLWGKSDIPLNWQINGTFKLLVMLRNRLDLPIPFVDRAYDNILRYFADPKHNERMDACSEWDALLVINTLQPFSKGYRQEEIEELASVRILDIIKFVGRSDGGFSSSPAHCQTSFVDFKMADPIVQSDVFGSCIFGQAIGECADILNIQKEAGIPGMKSGRGMDDRKVYDEEKETREKLKASLLHKN